MCGAIQNLPRFAARPEGVRRRGIPRVMLRNDTSDSYRGHSFNGVKFATVSRRPALVSSET